MSGAPKITIVLAIEAPPRVEITDDDGATWARLADWLIASGQSNLLHELLGLLREEKASA